MGLIPTGIDGAGETDQISGRKGKESPVAERHLNFLQIVKKGGTVSH